MKGLVSDLRHALRQLTKSPGFTLIAVLTLAIGMGATTTIFSVLDSSLLRPLPYPNSPRIVRVWHTFAPRGMMELSLSEPELIEYRHNETFAHLAGFSTGALTLTGSGIPLRVAASWVTSDFFAVFATRPFLGRVFSGDEYQSGHNQVVVLSFELWKNRFGGNTDVIGKSIVLNGQSCVAVGIMPRAFTFPSDETAVWQPLPISPASSNLGNHYLYLVGDLKPGVALQLATSDLATILRRIQQKYPHYYGQEVGIGVSLIPLREQMVGNVRPTILILMAGVGFMLLIACANVANLLLARGEKRKTEIATRVALGATHWRILQQALLENLVLFVAGGIAGSLLAILSTKILSLEDDFKITQIGRIGFDLRVFAFATGICLVTGLAFGLIPALRASHSNFTEVIKARSRNPAGSRHSRARDALVSSEIALSLVLLTGAGLMISSLLHLLGVNLGFNPRGVATVRLSLPEAEYSLGRTVEFYKQLQDRIQGLPGVQSVATVNQLPMSDVVANSSFEVEGRPLGTDINVADTKITSPDYFRAMQIPLLRGRALNEADAEAATESIVINQTLARKIWPGLNPVGQRIRLRADAPWLTVVGVVGDVKNHGVNTDTKPEVYFPYTERPMGLWADFRTATIVVRTATSPEEVVGAIRGQLRDLDPQIPIYKVATLQQSVSSSVSQTRFPALVLSFFAWIALTLAAIGVYGVLAYTVAQRNHEIGVRMALGASRDEIVRLVVRQALGWIALGGSAGLIAAFLLVRFMRTLLFEVSPYDARVLLLVVAVLSIVAVLAAALPARRAAKVDPVVALRYE